MASLVWGKAQQLWFYDDHEYYQVLGSLCHHDAYTITFETNSETESWGDAFRIKCLMPDSKTPDAFLDVMKTARRINCNDYVQYLYEYHNFDFDVGNKVLVGQYQKVKETVPSSFYQDFDDGYNLKFTRHDRSKKPAKTHPTGSTPVSKPPKPATPQKQDNPIPKVAPPPKPEPIPVSVGEIIKHKSFGTGTVYAVEGTYIRIRFDAVGEKSFVNPDAFKMGFLTKAE